MRFYLLLLSGLAGSVCFAQDSDTTASVYRSIERIANKETFSIWKFDIPPEKIIKQTYTEGFRFGLGIYTNPRLSPWFSVGGYFGYGTRDKQSKYGASVSLYPEKNLNSEIKLRYANDLYGLTWSKETGISARKRWNRFDVETQFMAQDIKVTFDYSYNGQDMTAAWNRNTEAKFRLKYVHKPYKRTLPLSTTHYPIFFLNVRLGFPSDHIGSTYKYIKTEAGAEKSWNIRKIGVTTFSLRGGWMSNKMPYPLTFTVAAAGQSLFLTDNTNWRTNFQALTGNLYAANQYFNAFFYHNFGTSLFKTNSKIFRPQIAISQSFGWSKLNHPEEHISTKFNILDMQTGYFESGIVIDDIIVIKTFNLLSFKFGGGLYAAYGSSVQKPFEKTLTPKIRVVASF